MFKYFQTLPLTLYTLDEYESNQIIPNIFIRSKFLSNVVSNNSLYDEYDIVDGETPETTAKKFYGDTGLHWIILQSNDILDPRFGWPLKPFDLKRFVEGKYNNINAPHHYEDSGGNVVSATIVLTTTSTDPSNNFAGISNNTTVTNNTNVGVGVITSKPNNQSVTIVTNPGQGGFIAGDNVLSSANTSHPGVTLTSISITSGIPITNLNFEDDNDNNENDNESKRRIKILKRALVPEIVSEFEQIVNK